MTDRSSEERSRFEKWYAQEYYWDKATDSKMKYTAWHAWQVGAIQARAALDARPKMGPGDYSCVTCGMGMMEPCEHWRGILARSTDESAAALEDRQEAAPAPEVQGTPTKKSCLYCNEAFSGCSMCRTQVCATCGEPVQNGVTCHEGKVISGIRTVPVGTPQKETPPAKCPYCDFNEGLGHAKFCRNYQVTRGSSMPYGADAQNFGAVPGGGVQGKEPQTQEPIFKVHHCEKCGVLCYGEQTACPICTARSEGEASGRRSAITEIQETVADWGRRSRDASFVEACDWCLKKCAELQEKP